MKSTKCRFCGIGFKYPVEYGKVRYCSGRCRIAHTPPQNAWEYKGCHGADYYAKSRRKKISAGDKIDYLVIYEHYDWMCGLCGEDIDRMLLHPDPMSATMDHRVPLGAGGKHTWDNLVPAHLECNGRKSDQKD